MNDETLGVDIPDIEPGSLSVEESEELRTFANQYQYIAFYKWIDDDTDYWCNTSLFATRRELVESLKCYSNVEISTLKIAKVKLNG